jgi:hypothetical protein
MEELDFYPEDPWKYIDTIDELPPVNQIHCDTRDFCILLDDEPATKGINRYKAQAETGYEGYKLNRAEVLGTLKTIESLSGGKRDWRLLRHKKLGWLKYIRFVKLDQSVELAGGSEPVYAIYTLEGRELIPIPRDYLNDEYFEQEQ